MIELKFKITGQIITLAEELTAPLIADSINQISASFTFSDDWIGLNKTAVISVNRTTYNVLIDLDGKINEVDIPVLEKGQVTFSVFGIKYEENLVNGKIETVETSFATVNQENIKVQASGYKKSDREIIYPQHNCPLSAYGIAVANGFVGTEQEWLDSLNGANISTVVSKNTYLEFPNVGNSGCIYISTTTNKIYRWDSTELKYFVIGSDYTNINVIDGGTSNG